MQPIVIRSRVLRGVTSVPVQVRAQWGKLDVPLSIVGLPSEEVTRETSLRVRSALCALDGFGVPLGVQVEIVPRLDTSFQASGLDLPIAVAIAGVRGMSVPDDQELFGELSFEGKIRPVRGAYVHARALAESSCSPRGLVGAAGNAYAFSMAPIDARVAESLSEVLAGRTMPVARCASLHGVASVGADLSDLALSGRVRRALEIAAAGGHNLLLVGPPGTGKMAAARRLTGLLPLLEPEQARDVASMHDAAGLLSRAFSDGGVPRPFRAPHHTVSVTGLVGGGTIMRPGEVSLAHRGVLLLDELPEFRAATLRALALVLRTGAIDFARSRWRTEIPAQPEIVVATSNGCPCGYAPSSRCVCSSDRIASFRKRLEQGPILFDLVVECLPDAAQAPPESSETVRARVAFAREHPAEVIAERAYRLVEGDRVMRVATTIASLAGSPVVQPSHLEEARALCGARSEASA